MTRRDTGTTVTAQHHYNALMYRQFGRLPSSLRDVSRWQREVVEAIVARSARAVEYRHNREAWGAFNARRANRARG